jgi:hypothetical protein
MKRELARPLGDLEVRRSSVGDTVRKLPTGEFEVELKSGKKLHMSEEMWNAWSSKAKNNEFDVDALPVNESIVVCAEENVNSGGNVSLQLVLVASAVLILAALLWKLQH